MPTGACRRLREADASVRLRLCAVARVERPVEELIRFVADPEGRVVPDLASRLPGRGVWVSADRESVEKAVRTRAFARSLKAEVTAGPDLAQQVEDLLRRRVLDSLSLANKAGQVTSGFAKIERAIAEGRAVALLHASDAGADGVEKLDRMLARWREAAAEAGGKNVNDDQKLAADRPSIRILACDELSLALGRTNVVHAALSSGGASRKFLHEAERLRRYRCGELPAGRTSFGNNPGSTQGNTEQA